MDNQKNPCESVLNFRGYPKANLVVFSIYNEDLEFVCERAVNENNHQALLRAEANAAIITEAGTVKNETGLTPRELLERYREAVNMLEKHKSWHIQHEQISFMDDDLLFQTEMIIQKSKS